MKCTVSAPSKYKALVNLYEVLWVQLNHKFDILIEQVEPLDKRLADVLKEPYEVKQYNGDDNSWKHYYLENGFEEYIKKVKSECEELGYYLKVELPEFERDVVGYRYVISFDDDDFKTGIYKSII